MAQKIDLGSPVFGAHGRSFFSFQGHRQSKASQTQGQCEGGLEVTGGHKIFCVLFATEADDSTWWRGRRPTGKNLANRAKMRKSLSSCNKTRPGYTQSPNKSPFLIPCKASPSPKQKRPTLQRRPFSNAFGTDHSPQYSSTNGLGEQKFNGAVISPSNRAL